MCLEDIGRGLLRNTLRELTLFDGLMLHTFIMYVVVETVLMIASCSEVITPFHCSL